MYCRAVSDPLIRKKLPPGWIDLCVGEAFVVRRALQDTYPSSLFNLEDVADGCDYQSPEGHEQLVALLEGRYGKHVVVTCGAKQGLLAVFYALKRLGQPYIDMRTPYWSQMPDAIRLGGLGMCLGNMPTGGSSYMIVSPNNPDGHVTTGDEAIEIRKKCDRLGTFLVHDAAYHTPVYVNGPTPKLTPTTIYSASKMYGLSGLRVGWVVTDDEHIKQHVMDYVETSTVGASLLSQRILTNIIKHEVLHPASEETFHWSARQLLDDNKRLVRALSPDVLDTSIVPEHGMFGWFKVGPKFDPEAAMVSIPPGSAFGDSTRVRINLAVEPALLRLAVERLNGTTN